MAQVGRTPARTIQEKAGVTPAQPVRPCLKIIEAKVRYKIKLRNVGYRLVYEVRDKKVVVVVVAIGKRGRNAVHKMAAKR